MEATATMISAFVAAVALVLTYVQFCKRVKLEHAQQVFKMQESTRNKEIVDFFRMIDYGENQGWYDGFHQNEKLEKMVDNALLLYNYIVYLQKQSLLTSKEFSYFSYEIDKIVSNEDVKRYFLFLHQYTKKAKLPFKYEHLLQYGIEKGYIKSESFDLK